MTRLALVVCLVCLVAAWSRGCRCDGRTPSAGPVIDLRADAGAR